MLSKMTKTNKSDQLLDECEPYFLDGVHTIAQFSQRTQSVFRDAVERHRAALSVALGFSDNEISPLDYCEPDKLQKAKPTDGLCIGVKLKFANLFEAAIYRYWDVDPRTTGIAIWTWINRRPALDRLSREVDALPDDPPEPVDSWGFDFGKNGTYYIYREFAESDIGELDSRLDELITYYAVLLRKVGGVRRFFSDESNSAVSIESKDAL